MPGASQRLRWHFSTSRGCTRRPQEASGGTRRLQEAPGGRRKPQGAPGSPRRLQEARGSPRRFQEAPGSPRKFQEAPGNPRRPQEASGGPRRIHEALGKPQETLGGPRRSTNWRATNVRRAPAGAQLSESMRAAPKRERHFAMSRAMCTASYSWRAFRIVDDKTGHVERKIVDLYWFFIVRMGPPG